MNSFTIGVVGNPNCGKTTLFNALTGAKQKVGNWPGVTVERKDGRFTHEGYDIQVVDLPGTYSVDVISVATSLDEKIARDYVLSGEADLIINIVDASNLERNLYLTMQLLEMGTPMVVALNMMDIAKQRGLKIDIAVLERHLGCPVVPITASAESGIDALKATTVKMGRDRQPPSVQITYPQEIEEAVGQLIPVLTGAKTTGKEKNNARWHAIKLLERDELAKERVDPGAEALVVKVTNDLEEKVGEDIDIMLANNRYGLIQALMKEGTKKTRRLTRTTSDTIDRVVLNRVMGIPIFLLVMYLMFMFTINLGGAFIDFFDIAAGTFFVDGFGELLHLLTTPEWLALLLADGLGGGVQVVATFIPIIGFLFLFLSLLEDSGYMARAAFVMDRFMRFIGLPGKSFVPILIGFGCNVPAIMATRTLENRRDRLLTIMMNPFMSCGARLPVYALFAAAFFPIGGQNVVFGLYLIGIVAAILTGLILKNTILKGESAPFVMELPPYHMPTFKGVVLRTWERLNGFIVRAGRVILPMVVVLTILNSIGTDGTFGHQDTGESVLSEIGRTISPAFSPLGIREENWPATVGVFTGVLAKEAVVGTLDSLYEQLSMAGTGNEQTGEEPFDFRGSMAEAFSSIPANLADLGGRLLDPLGISVGDIGNVQTAATEQEVAVGTFGEMARRFDGQIGAFAYLLFILLYFPCLAATATVYHETSLGWAAFVGCWTTGLAFLASTLFYQIATFSRHPDASLAWIIGLLSLFATVILGLWYYGKKDEGVPSFGGKVA